MGQALYRKYRSKNLSEIIGQEHVAKALTTALKNNHVSHAYLFTGPRGVGKTSVARILAHEINSVPYTDDSTHLDIIEIDAASNRRIDEIRELRERVNIAPSSARYKVYIIDEVHMLTKEAFNALLKTLEEPPAHVVFILATTEAHKLPETIVSRTQRFVFRPVGLDKVVTHLKALSKKEHIDITDEALALIASHGEGSVRDSISLLDQVRNTGEQVNAGDVQSMLGLAPDELVNNLIDQVEAGKMPEMVELLRQVHEQGYEAAMLAKQLGQTWRKRLLNSSSVFSAEVTLKMLENLLDISASQTPFALLEITLLRAALGQDTSSTPTQNDKPVVNVPKDNSKPTQNVTVDNKPEPVTNPKKSEPVTDNPVKPIKAPAAALDLSTWTQVLDSIKQNHNTLYGIARMAKPRFESGNLILALQFPFHYKRLEETRNKEILLKTLQELTGRSISITCELVPIESPLPSIKSEEFLVSEPETVEKDQLENINNIFGGAELLQSED
jgi:DNA polymerase-3 subunit gamma/tau